MKNLLKYFSVFKQNFGQGILVILYKLWPNQLFQSTMVSFWSNWKILLNFNLKSLQDTCAAIFVVFWWKPWIVYKKTDEWYIEWLRVTTNDNEWYKEWQRMTASDNEWYNEWQQMTTSDNEWQRVTTSSTTSDNEWYNKWKRVVQRVTMSGTTSDNEWQRVASRRITSDKVWQRVTANGNEWQHWQQWYNEWKRHSTLQIMDDCRPFNDKNRYTTTSRDGWLQLEWLDK